MQQGERYSPDKIKNMREKAYLQQDVSCAYKLMIDVTDGHETDLDDAAQAFVDTAKNASMTGQRIQVG